VEEWRGGEGSVEGKEEMIEKKKNPTAPCKILIPTNLTGIVM